MHKGIQAIKHKPEALYNLQENFAVVPGKFAALFAVSEGSFEKCSCKRVLLD
jgi:hypothetical protein